MSDQLSRCRYASGSVDIGPDALSSPDTVDLTPPASTQLFTEEGYYDRSDTALRIPNCRTRGRVA